MIELLPTHRVSHSPLFKKLRQLLVLFTLFLVPSTTWGQEVSTTYTFTKTETITSDPDYDFSVSSTSDGTNYGWKIKSGYYGVAGTPLDNALGFSNIPQYNGGNANAFTFDVISDFTLSGAFLSAEITYTLSNDNSTCKAEIYKDDNSTNMTLTSFDDLDASPKTLRWGNYTQENQFFEGHKIILHFSLGAGSNNASISIQSIKITTSQLIVDNYAVTSANRDNITEIQGGTPTVTFTPAAGNTPNTLVLDGANINGPIRSVMDDLTIHLKNSVSGESKIGILNGARSNGIKSLNNGKLTFIADAGAYLQIASTTSAITGFASVSFGTGVYLKTNTPTKYDTNGKNFNEQAGSANIVKNLEITSTPYYPLWIGGTQFTDNTTSIAGVSFIAGATNTLALKDVDQHTNIISGLTNLTITLENDNSITMTDSSAVIRSINPEASLTFQKAQNAANGSLYLENNKNYAGGASPIIKNFQSVSYTGLNYASTTETAINDASTHDATLTSSEIYSLRVGGQFVTATSSSGTGWSYDNDNKKLTLSGATITGQIISGLGDLTIFLTGNTILKAAGSETSLIHSTNNGILSFDTDPAAIGSLAFKDNTGNSVFAGEPISGFTSKTYSNGIDYDATEKKIGVTTYNFSIGGVNITSATKTDVLGDGKVTYDSENHIFTLNDGTTIRGVIEYYETAALTIALNGTSTITYTGGTYAINGNGEELTFVKAPNAATNTCLTITGHDAYDSILGFSNSSSPNMGTGIYWKPLSKYVSIVTTDPEFVIVGDYVITDQPVTSTGTITYDTTNKVLTIDRFVKTDNSDPSNDPVPPTYIKSGVVGLTVKLKGNSEINYSRNDYIFEAIGTGATILFDGTEGGDLNMETNSNNQPLSGFAEITYNKLACWNTSDKHHTIQEPIAPEMEEDNNTVKLTKPYTDGSIKYSIDYADDTPDVSNATYSTAFAMTAPGTVTAWVEANNVTTSTVKGKYFGYKDAPYTMLANETKTPELIPAIETGDNIDYAADPYTSSDAGVATFAVGVITAVAFGNATLTTTLQTSGVAQNVVILNHNKQFETVVKVAKDITGISFSGNAQYSSYCNTDADDLTLPNGIKAYAVKIPTSGNEVVLSEIGFIPGTVNSRNPIYTPILLKRDDTSKTSFGTVTKYVRESGYTLPSNDLKFTTAGENTNGKECYILYKDAFVKATGTIAQYRCYLEKPSTNPNPARGFVIEGGDDGSTAIDDTLINEEETGNGEWYDLQGRRIQKPTKPGLYIVNGKKVVVNNK